LLNIAGEQQRQCTAITSVRQLSSC